MAGRRPKPSALRLIEGNPGKRPLPPEPQIDLSGLDPPWVLSKKARTEWDRVSEILARAKLLTEADKSALAIYSEQYEIWSTAMNRVRRHGVVLVNPQTGVPMRSPYMQVANDASAQMTRIMLEFGMTPASRTKVPVGDGPTENPFDDLDE